MSAWTLGEWYSVVGTGTVLVIGGIAWLVGRFSEQWGNRLAAVTLAWAFSTLVMALLMWNRPMPA